MKQSKQEQCFQKRTIDNSILQLLTHKTIDNSILQLLTHKTTDNSILQLLTHKTNMYYHVKSNDSQSCLHLDAKKAVTPEIRERSTSLCIKNIWILFMHVGNKSQALTLCLLIIHCLDSKQSIKVRLEIIAIFYSIWSYT